MGPHTRSEQDTRFDADCSSRCRQAEGAIARLQVSVLGAISEQSQKYRVTLEDKSNSETALKRKILDLSEKIDILEADKENLIDRLASKARHIEELEATLTERTAQYRIANTRAIKYSTMLLEVTGGSEASTAVDNIHINRSKAEVSSGLEPVLSPPRTKSSDSDSKACSRSRTSQEEGRLAAGLRANVATIDGISYPDNPIQAQNQLQDTKSHTEAASGSRRLVTPSEKNAITDHDGDKESSDLTVVSDSLPGSHNNPRSKTSKQSISKQFAYVHVKSDLRTDHGVSCPREAIDDKSRLYASITSGLQHRGIGTIALQRKGMEATDDIGADTRVDERLHESVEVHKPLPMIAANNTEVTTDDAGAGKRDLCSLERKYSLGAQPHRRIKLDRREFPRRNSDGLDSELLSFREECDIEDVANDQGLEPFNQPESMDSQLKGFLEHKRKIEEAERKRLPAKYVEVVRGKDKRAKLKGYDCGDCRKFHELVGGQLTAQQRIQITSKHRHHSSPVNTPPGIWDMTLSTSHLNLPDCDI